MFYNSCGLGSLFSVVAVDLIAVRAKQRQEKKRIAELWERSKKFPRKLKKATRKRLILDFAIADYELFPDLSDSDIMECASFLQKAVAKKM